MKNIILGFSCLLYVSTGFSQDYKRVILSEFDEYFEAISSGNYDRSMDFIVDELFDIVPREQMVVLMESTFNDPSIEFELDKAKNVEISKAKKVNNKYYSFLTYTNLIKMKFLEDEGAEEESAEEKKTRINLMKLSFENTFGVGNVKYNEATDFFEINASKKALAISSNKKKNWKFLVIEENQKAIFERILPAKIFKKLKI